MIDAPPTGENRVRGPRRAGVSQMSAALSLRELRRLLVTGPDELIRRQRGPARVALVTGVIFFFAGLVKFVFHRWELDAFRSFGLPWPSALELAAGGLETLGGVLLVARRVVVPVALLLAATMLVALAASGIGHGDVIPSLTVAPALLVAMLYLLACGLRSGHSPALETGA